MLLPSDSLPWLLKHLSPQLLLLAISIRFALFYSQVSGDTNGLNHYTHNPITAR